MKSKYVTFSKLEITNVGHKKRQQAIDSIKLNRIEI